MTTKNPMRRQELLDAAHKIFTKKGYESTSINDILNEVGVSKGAFYHHFESKGDLLVSLIDQLVEESLFNLKGISEDTTLTGVEKCKKVIGISLKLKLKQTENSDEVYRTLRSEGNSILFHNIRQQWLMCSTPEIAKILEQGVQQGDFNIEHVKETARAFLLVVSDFTDQVKHLVSTSVSESEAKNMLDQSLHKLQTLVENLLGAKNGTLSLRGF